MKTGQDLNLKQLMVILEELKQIMERKGKLIKQLAKLIIKCAMSVATYSVIIIINMHALPPI